MTHRDDVLMTWIAWITASMAASNLSTPPELMIMIFIPVYDLKICELYVNLV